MKVSKNVSWAQANELILGVVRTIDDDLCNEFYDYIREVRSNKNTKPWQLAEVIYQYIHQKEYSNL